MNSQRFDLKIAMNVLLRPNALVNPTCVVEPTTWQALPAMLLVERSGFGLNDLLGCRPMNQPCLRGGLYDKTRRRARCRRVRSGANNGNSIRYPAARPCTTEGQRNELAAEADGCPGQISGER